MIVSLNNSAPVFVHKILAPFEAEMNSVFMLFCPKVVVTPFLGVSLSCTLIFGGHYSTLSDFAEYLHNGAKFIFDVVLTIKILGHLLLCMKWLKICIQINLMVLNSFLVFFLYQPQFYISPELILP